MLTTLMNLIVGGLFLLLFPTQARKLIVWMVNFCSKLFSGEVLDLENAVRLSYIRVLGILNLFIGLLVWLRYVPVI
jgi:uncharacterized protein YjeT (DUF2065 family)